MRILLSLYACRPDKGSEPGVGWAWAIGMAKREPTVVLTRRFNRSAIEAALPKIPESERPAFLYYDLPEPIRRWYDDKRVIPPQLYYLIWQWFARRAFDHSGEKVDIIHHVTFCSYVLPGFWWHRKEKVVLGPLGGGAVCPISLLRVFRFQKRPAEWMRTITRRVPAFVPCFLRSRHFADAVAFTDQDMMRRFSGKGPRITLHCLDVGSPEALQTAVPLPNPEPKAQIFWAGVLHGRKAGVLALHAYRKAFPEPEGAPILSFCGEGQERNRLERLAHSLGISNRIRFHGSLPQERLWAEMRSSEMFLFTSVRDTCGSVNLEAMACGLPVVALRHQGVGELVNDSCGILVSPTDWNGTVSGLAEAMRRLHDHPELRDRLGQAARTRAVSDFAWDRKFDRFHRLYERLMQSDDSSANHPTC